MLSRELLGMENHLAQVHGGVELQPHVVLAEAACQTVSSSPEAGGESSPQRSAFLL